ncbi:ribonuclease H protein, partial [Trifolium medium]|nr:ribonuclease H protein [Trifolium medium]
MGSLGRFIGFIGMVCLDRSQGVLGVRKVKEFNVALWDKWCWRLKTERDSLWRHVLFHKYGEVRGEIEHGGRKVSTWWKYIDDPWLGEGIVLSERFSRLAELFPEPGIMVGDMHRRGWGVGGAGWCWRRQLFVCKEELLE